MNQELKFDELNNIIDEVKAEYHEEENIAPNEKIAVTEDDLDAVVEFLILAYTFGVRDGCFQLKVSLSPDEDKMQQAIDKKIKGENWRERLENGSDIATIVETEGIRVYNQAVLDVGETQEGVYKTWVTKKDDKVRETHDFLEGVEVPLDEYFYTIDGDSALQPGGFVLAENNVNCRCRIELTEGTV